MPSHTVLPWILSGIGIPTFVYAAGIAAVLRSPFLENQLVYQHRLRLLKGRDLDRPEQFGFAHRQATPFRIATDDGHNLHAWHVLPLGLYYKHAPRLLRDTAHRRPFAADADFTETVNFRLIREDPEARLVIHTHGASGTLTAWSRSASYRALSSLSPSKIHVLAFDYRGFGLSPGVPSEAGLLSDARAAFQWATDVAKIPPERIVVFGQSLGSGVAISLVDDLSLRSISPAGLVISSSFPDVATVLAEYRPAFGLRALGPFVRFPGVMDYFRRSMRNKWPNKQRLAEVVRRSSRYHIEILHAEDDEIVPRHLSDIIFEHAAKADAALEAKDFEQEKKRRLVQLGDGGWYVEWPTSKGFIRQEVVNYGRHDKIMAQPQTAMAIMRAFQSTSPNFGVD
ncbi:Alpha/Beta hydrolase protein [Xylariomycetidae sp. FL2044]|nr:Alpha/Beta hydrolase protein [Xylariomycetidae sp. FL2044]